MHSKVALIVSIMVLTFVIVGCGTSPASSLSCEHEESTLSGYTGIGVVHTSNVRSVLRVGDTPVGEPSETIQQFTENGIAFTTKIYDESIIKPGSYQVDIMYLTDVLKTYDIRLTANRSPMLTVFCR